MSCSDPRICHPSASPNGSPDTADMPPAVRAMQYLYLGARLTSYTSSESWGCRTARQVPTLGMYGGRSSTASHARRTTARTAATTCSTATCGGDVNSEGITMRLPRDGSAGLHQPGFAGWNDHLRLGQAL